MLLTCRLLENGDNPALFGVRHFLGQTPIGHESRNIEEFNPDTMLDKSVLYNTGDGLGDFSGGEINERDVQFGPECIHAAHHNKRDCRSQES
jgi:hypothetical protein